MREGAVSLSGDTMENARSTGSFVTLTHARLRATQGDVAGAARILRAILELRPGCGEARELLAGIEDRVEIAHKEPVENPAEAVRPATAQDLVWRFREALTGRGCRARDVPLSLWLQRARRNRGERRVR